jgi:hypothetical protein
MPRPTIITRIQIVRFCDYVFLVRTRNGRTNVTSKARIA